MDTKLIIGVIVVLALVGTAIGVNILYPSAPKIYITPTVEKVMEPQSMAASFFICTMDNTPYLVYTSTNQNNLTLYITKVIDGKELSLGKPVLLLAGNFGHSVISNYGNTIYIATYFDNKTTILLSLEKSGSTFDIVGTTRIPNLYPINVFANNNGVYLLGENKNADSIELINAETGHAIYHSNAKLVISSYLISYGDKEFLTTYTSTTGGYETKVIELTGTSNPREIFNSSGNLARVFAMHAGNEEYLYLFGHTTTLYKINLNDYSTKKYDINTATGIYYSSSQSLFIGLSGRNYAYSTDGVHFKQFYTPGENDVILTSSGSVTVNENSLYILKYVTNNGLYIMNFDFTGVPNF